MSVNQLKAGALLSYLSIGLNTIIGLLYTPFMLRMMGQSEYGLYSLAASVISYLTVLDLGFGNAIIRYTAKYRVEGKKEEQYNMFGMFLLIYSIISLLTLLIGYFLYENITEIFNEAMSTEEVRKTRIMLLIMTFNLAFTFPFSLFGSILTAYEEFIFQKTINIIRIIINPIVMIFMLYAGYRAIGMVVIVTIFNVITLLINCWYCFNKLQIKVKFKNFEWGFFKEVSIYSFWILLNTIMDRIYWGSGQFILGIYRGTIAVSVYAVAIQLEQMYMNFSLAISGVFLPKITSITFKEESTKLLSNLFVKVGRIQYIIMAYILSGFIVFGYPFILLWAGIEYSNAYYITLLFFVALIIPLIQNLGIVILQARNRLKFRSICYVVISILSLFISIPLAQKYGEIGCAIAVASALFLGQGLIMNLYYWKRIKIDIPLFWREIIKMSLTPFAFSLMGFFVVQNIEMSVAKLCFSTIVFSIMYFISSWFLDLNKYEKDLIGEPIKRIWNIAHDRYKR